MQLLHWQLVACSTTLVYGPYGPPEGGGVPLYGVQSYSDVACSCVFASQHWTWILQNECASVLLPEVYLCNLYVCSVKQPPAHTETCILHFSLKSG